MLIMAMKHHKTVSSISEPLGGALCFNISLNGHNFTPNSAIYRALETRTWLECIFKKNVFILLDGNKQNVKIRDETISVDLIIVALN